MLYFNSCYQFKYSQPNRLKIHFWCFWVKYKIFLPHKFSIVLCNKLLSIVPYFSDGKKVFTPGVDICLLRTEWVSSRRLERHCFVENIFQSQGPVFNYFILQTFGEITFARLFLEVSQFSGCSWRFLFRFLSHTLCVNSFQIRVHWFASKNYVIATVVPSTRYAWKIQLESYSLDVLKSNIAPASQNKC